MVKRGPYNDLKTDVIKRFWQHMIRRHRDELRHGLAQPVGARWHVVPELDCCVSAPGIPKANRTLNIERLGAASYDYELGGVTVIWTARHPDRGPVIVGLYDNATVFRYMPPDEPVRPFIAKARTEDCHLVPVARRSFDIIQKRKGFPGMAAAWFPGLHAEGPAQAMLADVSAYLPTIRQYTHTGEKN